MYGRELYGMHVGIEEGIVLGVVFDCMGHCTIPVGFGSTVTMNHLEGEIIIAEALVPHQAIVHKEALVVQPPNGEPG